MVDRLSSRHVTVRAPYGTFKANPLRPIEIDTVVLVKWKGKLCMADVKDIVENQKDAKAEFPPPATKILHVHLLTELRRLDGWVAGDWSFPPKGLFDAYIKAEHPSTLDFTKDNDRRIVYSDSNVVPMDLIEESKQNLFRNGGGWRWYSSAVRDYCFDELEPCRVDQIVRELYDLKVYNLHARPESLPQHSELCRWIALLLLQLQDPKKAAELETFLSELKRKAEDFFRGMKYVGGGPMGGKPIKAEDGMFYYMRYRQLDGVKEKKGMLSYACFPEAEDGTSELFNCFNDHFSNPAIDTFEQTLRLAELERVMRQWVDEKRVDPSTFPLLREPEIEPESKEEAGAGPKIEPKIEPEIQPKLRMQEARRSKRSSVKRHDYNAMVKGCSAEKQNAGEVRRRKTMLAAGKEPAGKGKEEDNEAGAGSSGF